MARFEFKQAVLLRQGPAGHGGKHLQFSKGVHEVDAKAQEHHTFKHFAKHGLIVPFKAKEQGELPEASSDIAKGAAAAAKAVQGPDEEIGGEADESPKKKEKRK